MSYWANLYYRFIVNSWQEMSPMEYGYLLIIIAIAGYLSMKSVGR